MKSFITFVNRFMKTMINEKNKDAWCVNAFHALSGNNNGTTKICCMIRADTEKLALGTNTIEENFNQEHIVSVRDALEKGVRHSDCKWCWHEERSGRKSKRLRDNEKYLKVVKETGKEYEGLAKFELNLGNTCNLKCRTCAPHSSSTWMKEDYEVYSKPLYSSYKQYAEQMKKYSQTYDDDSPFWEDLEKNLPTVKQFDFYGGEPFMSNRMWSTLEKAVELGYAKDIELHYATNGTHWPEDKVQIFNEFKHLNLNFSIDGIGEQFEYMRFPAQWDDAQQKMEKARLFKQKHHDMHLSWCSTLSAINICHLPTMLDEFYRVYASDFGLYLNLVHGPIEFNLSTLHPKVRKYVLSVLETIPSEYSQVREHYLPGIINFINSEDNLDETTNSTRKFLEKIKKHDEYRNQSFEKTFGEYYDRIKGVFIL